MGEHFNHITCNATVKKKKEYQEWGGNITGVYL